jgi:hypothetical protein
VRLPTGHGERHASSPELLVDGEEKKSGSTVASPQRGGATVADGGPATVRRKRRVSSSSTGEERRGKALGRRSPDEARDGEGGGNSDGGGSDSGAWHLQIGACGHGWSGRRRRARGSVGRSRRGCRLVRRGVWDAVRSGAFGTARRAVPTAALNRCVGVARGGHAAAARCHAGPVRRATADKRDPLVSDF